MRTKTCSGRGGVPKFASPSRVSTTQSLHFFNHEHELDEANGETLSKMNGNVDMSSAYNDDEIGIHIENHRGSGWSGDFMDADLMEEEPCIKCNRHDESLLLWSQSDDVGNIYCPYFWYKCELMRTKELRKKAMETKKQLACFIDPKSFTGDKKKENCRTDKGKELNTSSLHQERNYGYGGCEGQMDDVQVENLIVEVEGKLENAGDNAKTADSCDRFKRALENQNGETIPVEDLGHVDNSGHEKIVEDQVQEEPHTACCVGEEYVVDILLNLSKGNIPDSEKLKEESVLQEVVRGHNLRVLFHQKSCPHQKMPTQRTKSQNVDSSKKLSPPKGAQLEKIAQARNEKSTASKSLHKFLVKICKNFTFASEKRRSLHWTAEEEEEMLKEGVEKFSTKVNKNLPWKKVLEFGCHVFYPIRTPSDLKDKWRKIMAKESSAISRSYLETIASEIVGLSSVYNLINEFMASIDRSKNSRIWGNSRCKSLQLHFSGSLIRQSMTERLIRSLRVFRSRPNSPVPDPGIHNQE
ncbi:hypothetical protein KPL70_017896 [Citrus sinensis]|nr:hypothetical protein KPL70_017896 [Citrus sinensis]